MKKKEENKTIFSEDLEKASEEFARCYDQGTCDGVAQDCFIAGAQWQKKQMMKDAIVLDDFCIDDFSCGYYNLCVEQGLTSEDKVKIIIVKEDKG